MGNARTIGLGNPPPFFFAPTWAPDSKKITYTDKRLNLWYVDLNNPAPVKIDTDTYFSFSAGIHSAWSPDSRWIAYTKVLANHMRAVFVYSLESKTSTQITDGLSDVEYAVFAKGEKYFYSPASRIPAPQKR